LLIFDFLVAIRAKKQKPTASYQTGGGFDFADTREFLGQQPPRASGRTHTTTATTLAAAGMANQHHGLILDILRRRVNHKKCST
jgi:hypothetical protein